MPGKKVAAVVTVEQYSDATIANLIGSHKDGSELCHVLRNVGYTAEHIHQKNDDDVVDILESMVRKLEDGDLFLFYFAGHGFTPDGTSEHLLLGPDARLGRIERGYPRHTIELSYLDDLFTRPGLDRMFILDACRTHVSKGRGGSASLLTEQHLRDIGNSRVDTAGSYAILNSCSKGQQACELPGRRQGLFTAAFTDVLLEYYNNGDGLSADSALKETVASRMKQLALAEGLSGNQDPAFRSGGPGTIVLVDGSDASFKVHKRNSASWDSERSSSELPIPEKTSVSGKEEVPGVFIGKTPKWKITSAPEGAEVYLNGEKKGKTPLVLRRLPGGVYTFRAEKAGFVVWDEDVTYTGSSGEAYLQIELDRDLSYTSYNDGHFLRDRKTLIVIDTKTGLEWFVGPDKDTTHYEAQTWVDGLSGYWRLPKITELKELYDSGITSKSLGPFADSGWRVWSGKVDPEDSSRACRFDFDFASERWSSRAYSGNIRVFVVRSRG